MKTVLVCHAGSRLTREGFSRWMSSFSDLVGIVEIHEKGGRVKQRIKAEIRRVGSLRFIFDVLPYRIYSRAVHTRSDRLWEENKLNELCRNYKNIPATTEIITTDSPNSIEVKKFLTRVAPDMILARCKTLINQEIFTIPKDGTFVLHPGICPEYRNAHGCFWAMANNEPDKVGMTLLKIDTGIDTGPVYGYYSYDYDIHHESPNIIYNRVVFDNLQKLQEKILEIHDGKAETINTAGRRSNVWGQPWLSKYIKLKWKVVK